MKKVSRYILAYSLWLVSIVIAGVVGLIVQDVLSNGLTLSAASAARNNPRADFYLGLQLRAAEPWLYVLYGLAMVVVIAFLEHYYRNGVDMERLLSRFLKVTTIEIGVLAFAHIARIAISASLGSVAWTGLLIVAVEIVITAAFIWLYRSGGVHKVSI